MFYELLRRSLFEFSHTDNLIFRFLFVLRRPIIQFQNMLEELSRATERFLEEASKYGEVSLFTLFYHVFLFALNFVCFSFDPHGGRCDSETKIDLLVVFFTKKSNKNRFPFVIDTTCDSIKPGG